MDKIHLKQSNNTGMLDILFCMALFFFVAMYISSLTTETDKSKKNTETKADYLITIQWPNEMHDDVDTYFEDPTGKLIHYRQKAAGLMHLDRDDLGRSNDRITLPDGSTIQYPFNKEIITIRGIIPGEYTLNVHLYNRKTEAGKEIPVTVTIERLNPWKIAYMKVVNLKQAGDEQTVCRFTLDKEGAMTNVNDLEKRFIGNDPELMEEGQVP